MNYHLLIDHFFTDKFIELVDRIVPDKNIYIFTFNEPTRFVKSKRGIITPYGSKEMEHLKNKITLNDRIFVHWFHNQVWDLISTLNNEIPVYLFFWGGDFLNDDLYFSNFNYDYHTKKIVDYNLKKKNVSIRKLFLNKSFKDLSFKSLLIEKLLFRKKNNNELSTDYLIKLNFLNRLDFFCHWNKFDYDIILSKYNCSPKFVPFFYGMELEQITSGFNNKSEVTNVWLGNSDTETNNHLDALYDLRKFRNCNFQIFCPLNYGFSKDYGDLVSKEGSLIFGEKFISLREFIPYSEYISFLQKVDVAVMYHNRSQASGNIFVLIKLGKKVFLKSQSTIYKLLVQLGIVVFDSNDIKNITYQDFIKPLDQSQVESNVQKISDTFSQQNCFKNYLSILN
jgi:hypothetical protein